MRQSLQGRSPWRCLMVCCTKDWLLAWWHGLKTFEQGHLWPLGPERIKFSVWPKCYPKDFSKYRDLLYFLSWFLESASWLGRPTCQLWHGLSWEPETTSEKPSSTSAGKFQSPIQAAQERGMGRHSSPADIRCSEGSRTGSRQTLRPVYEIFLCSSSQSEV